MSNLHAELTLLDDGSMVLTDRKSRNGTGLVEGGQVRWIQQCQVDPGAQLRLGAVTVPMGTILRDLGMLDCGAAKPARRGEVIAGEARPSVHRCRRCGAVKPTRADCPECGA